jgi:N-methylhydantoinase A
MYRISVDTGGTFTDVVVTNSDGQLTIGKALTTPERSFAGLSNAVRNAAEQLGIKYETLLSQASVLVYGTTRATNAIVERKVGKTALLVTAGFPDILVYRQGGKLNALQLNIEFPPPYIPKSLTFEIPERVDAEGGVVLPIDKDKVRKIIQTLKQRNVEAVAVCFLWSIINPEHEREVGRILSELLPAVPHTLSHDLNPIIREYPRASSAAIDASLKPLMQKHLSELKNDLQAAGFRGELLISSSSGGVMHIDDVTRKPIYMAKSGPAMAPLAGIASTKAEGLDGDVIVVDTGGTTFDVALIRGGRVKYSRDTWLGPKYISTLLGMATVDIRSVGAGGGSIAWVDAGGMLRVGPQSAGSVPGPACYDKGGEHATVTDAAVALGYIDPIRFLGGRMQLNFAKAIGVVDRIAAQLGKSTNETASAILQISSETMIKAIEDITVNDGVNPRESVLVAGGGAAGLNILPIAKNLGCRQVIIPKTAGALSASGAQHSDIAIDFSIAAYSSSNAFEHQKVRDALAKLTGQADLFETELRNRGVTTFGRELFVEARYVGQQWEIEVAVSDDWHPDQAAALKAAFDVTHRRLYTVAQPEAPIETINWRLRLTAILPRSKTTWPVYKVKDACERRSRAYFANAGFLDATVIDGSSVGTDVEINGPAVIEEPNTTIVIPPGISGHLTKAGNYVFTLGDADA